MTDCKNHGEDENWNLIQKRRSLSNNFERKALCLKAQKLAIKVAAKGTIIGGERCHFNENFDSAADVEITDKAKFDDDDIIKFCNYPIEQLQCQTGVFK